MPTLFETTRNGDHYKVTSQGNTRRLYKNGVCHSDYSSKYPFSGSIWDLLFLGVLALEDRETPRILILGVGGGNLLHLFGQFTPNASVTGVELDSLHIKLCLEYFGHEKATLVEADAREYVTRAPNDSFDLVIDDVFGESDEGPVRAIALDRAWSRELSRITAPHGVVMINTCNPNERPRHIHEIGEHCYKLKSKTCENEVYAVSNRPFNIADLRKTYQDMAKGKHRGVASFRAYKA